MIKKKNSKFNFSIFKLIEYSEFSFLKTENFKKNDLIYINSFIKLNFNEKNFSFFILNFLHLIKGLKQYIRIIKFLSLKKKKHIYLTSEFNHFFFIKFLLSKLFKSNDITLQSEKQSKVNFVKIKKDHNNYYKFLLLLNLSLNSSKKNLDKLVSNNLFLIDEVNSKLKTKNDSFYKIFNEVSDFKKIIFLLLLLEKYLKK
jgi:hypothetical protein